MFGSKLSDLQTVTEDSSQSKCWLKGFKGFAAVLRFVKTCFTSLLNKLAVFNQAHSVFAMQSGSANCSLTFEETLHPHYDFSAAHSNPTVTVIVTGLIIMQRFFQMLILFCSG